MFWIIIFHRRPTREIKFIFTDEKYLNKNYPNNSAKISDFWGNIDHNLVEMFVPIKNFKDWKNIKNYKVVNGKLTKKSEEEIKNNRNSFKVEPNTLTIENDAKIDTGIKVTKTEINKIKE